MHRPSRFTTFTLELALRHSYGKNAEINSDCLFKFSIDRQYTYIPYNVNKLITLEVKGVLNRSTIMSQQSSITKCISIATVDTNEPPNLRAEHPKQNSCEYNIKVVHV